MQVALIQDWLVGNKESERVLEDLCQLYPNAEIYTLFHDKGKCSPIIEKRVIHTSFLNKFPQIAKRYQYFVPLFPVAVDTLKLPETIDLVISASECVINGIHLPSKARFISYFQSPMRFVYQKESKSNLLSQLGQKMAAPYLKTWERIALEKVDMAMTHSSELKEQLEKIYNMKVKVIPPSTHVDSGLANQSKEDYFLMAIDFDRPNYAFPIFEVFKKLDLPLRVVCLGGSAESYRLRAGKNIRFFGKMPPEELSSTMSKAKSFICASQDFQLLATEAISLGTPVLAPRTMRNLEVFNWNTCVFFQDFKTSSLEDAVRTFQSREFEAKDFARFAEEHGPQNFMKRFDESVSQLMN